MARDTGLPATSTTLTVTSTVSMPSLYLTNPILSRPGVTLTLAEAEIVSALEAVATLTEPAPRLRPDVNVAALPVLGTIVPRVGGISDHAAATCTGLP